MKALVTGSNGFIGSRLVEKLLHRGEQVRCLVRKTSNLRWIKDLDVEFVYGELTDESSLNPAMKGVDVIFHLAGVTKARNRQGYFLGNYQGTINLINASKNYGFDDQKFVFVSSLAAAGPAPSPTPLSEEDISKPISYYGKAKLAAEKAVLDMAPQRPVTIIRPPAVYGPRDSDVYQMFRYINKGLKPLLGGRDRLTSLVHVDDLVQGILLSADLQQSNGRLYFICEDSVYDWKTIADEIARIMNKRTFTIHIPISILDLVAFFSELGARITSKPALLNKQKVLEMKQQYWICDNSRAKKELGFLPTMPLSIGIADTVEWYRSNGWL